MNEAKQNYAAMAESEFDLRREVVRLRAINKDLLAALQGTMSETAEQVKHTPRLEEARRILESPNRAYELLNLIGVRDELLEACKAAFRALPGSADAIAIQCQFAIAKAEGK